MLAFVLGFGRIRAIHCKLDIPLHSAWSQSPSRQPPQSAPRSLPSPLLQIPVRPQPIYQRAPDHSGLRPILGLRSPFQRRAFGGVETDVDLFGAWHARNVARWDARGNIAIDAQGRKAVGCACGRAWTRKAARSAFLQARPLPHPTRSRNPSPARRLINRSKQPPPNAPRPRLQRGTRRAFRSDDLAASRRCLHLPKPCNFRRCG